MAAQGGDEMGECSLRGSQGDHSVKGTWVPPGKTALGLAPFVLRTRPAFLHFSPSAPSPS